jgi:hypothetical protein
LCHAASTNTRVSSIFCFEHWPGTHNECPRTSCFDFPAIRCHDSSILKVNFSDRISLACNVTDENLSPRTRYIQNCSLLHINSVREVCSSTNGEDWEIAKVPTIHIFPQVLDLFHTLDEFPTVWTKKKSSSCFQPVLCSVQNFLDNRHSTLQFNVYKYKRFKVQIERLSISNMTDDFGRCVRLFEVFNFLFSELDIHSRYTGASVDSSGRIHSIPISSRRLSKDVDPTIGAVTPVGGG